MPTAEDVYLRSPRPLQTLLANAAAIRTWRNRYGADFAALLAEYEDRDSWSKADFAAYADAQRSLALARAARTAYYQTVFNKMGAHWTELIAKDAFSEIPLTSKQAFRSNPEAFRPRPVQPTDAVIRTSGTTGVPTELLKDRRAAEHQWAVWWRYRRWHGIDLDTPCALFAGRRIMRDDQSAPFWRTNHVGKELRFSSYHISQSSAPLYARRLNAGEFTWIHGFSSAIANLARFIVDDDISITAPIQLLTLGGEGVLPWQADLIEAAFGTRPIHHYGLTEQAANASVCPKGALHVDEDFSHVELVGPSEKPQRIVGTPFTNEATALLRYDTGDLTRPSSSGCSCGRPTVVLDGIDGRGDETVELPDGRMVGPRRAFRSDLNLREAQIVQHHDLSLTLRYVPGPGWSSTHEDAVVEALRVYVGNDLPVRCEVMDAVPKSDSGKLRLVVREDKPL